MTNAGAFEHNGAPVAREHFYAIACDPRRSVAVEACAGAGKTWMLVSRMVRALLEGSAPQDILAITFTKKAAGEMRQRLQQWLAEFATADDAALREALRVRGMVAAATPEQLQTLRQMHATLLHSGRPVQIRTFHSWFAALLRSAPLAVLHELGLPTQYELLENDAQAIAQVWRRFQTRVAQDTDARADYLASVAAYGRHQAHKALESALAKRVEFALADAQGVVDNSVGHFTAQYPDFAGLAHPGDQLTQPNIVQLLQDAARALGVSGQATCTKAASALERAMTDGDIAGVFAALLTDKGTPRKLSDKIAGIETVRQAQDMLLRTQQAQLQHAAWEHQRRMARLTRGLVEDYATLKRERGWVDMGDLERAALVLMSDPLLSGWVQERLDARVRHLLIDEFQDTNPLQWQALSAWLSGYGGAGNAPSVFIVGDPKQSIYRFRRAEPQVFKAAKGLDGDVLSCDHTRRNATAIIGVVNAVMAQAQTAGEFDGYRQHSTESTDTGQVLKLPRILRDAKLQKSEKSDEEEWVWRDSLTTPRVEIEDTRKTLECRQAAQWLAQQLHNPVLGLRPKDVMVLSRKRERLGLMQAELAALHLPTQQPEKTDLCDMPEVQDLVALLDVLVSTQHDLSLARALKSPVFNASDEDLVQLVIKKRALEAQLEDKTVVTWWQTLQQATDLPATLATVGATLLLWKQWMDSLPPHDALSAIYDHGDVLARYAAAAPSTQRDSVLANMRALLNAVLSLDGGRYTTPYGLVRALRAGGIPAPVRSDAAAVRLLTVHGAKGLEAPLVLLLDTDGESPRAESMGVLVNWPGEAAYPQRFVFLASESRPPPCVVDALALEQVERRREELNGLYVALTRTQTMLVISSMEPHIANAGSWWQRLEALVTEAVVEEVVDAGVGPATSAVSLEPTTDAVDPLITLKILQNRPLAPVEHAQAAIKKIAVSASEDTTDSRVGQAMHRLLEWVSPAPGGVDAAPWTDVQLARAQTEFALDSAEIHTARAMALGILQGEGAWAWDTTQLRWWGNEVPMIQRGRTIRLDRLVQQGATCEWWILDYKSASRPQDQPELLAQLASYRNAVRQAYPGQVVRAAFLTPQGTLIE
jgi:ATP-dependent helicase/nuclease subunit A